MTRVLGSRSRSRSLRLVVAAAVVVIAIAVVLVLALRPRHFGPANLTVTRTPVGAAIPSGFLGISTETYSFEKYTGSNPQAINPVFLRMLRDLGPGGQHPVLRVGGDSTDWSWYPAPGLTEPKGIKFTITPSWLQILHATAQATGGKILIGVNLEGNERAVAAAEARAYVQYIGRSHLQAIEIGNEPELYHHFPLYDLANGTPVTGRPNSYTEADYFAQFKSWTAAMPAGVPLAGPAFGFGKWIAELPEFLAAAPKLSLVTVHAYPLQHCGAAGQHLTIDDVLAPSADQGFLKEVAPYTAMAARAGKPMRIDEVNAISCGGTANVSDSFASALWMVNTLFGLARTGVGGVNVHMVPGSINSILDPIDTAPTHPIAAQPAFYAMMMFARAAPQGARILHIAGSTGPLQQAFATRAPDGTIHVVLTSKNATRSARITLAVPGASGAATVTALRARSLAATEGVTLGGQTFGAATSTGELAGRAQHETIARAGGGHYTVIVPPASAVMLTLHPAS